MKVQKVRKGKVLKTIIRSEHDGNLETSSVFSEIDNLDTKTITEARDNYERTFVKIREMLEQNEQFCCDDESDRLSLTQSIADILRKSNLIRKEEK